MSDRIDIPPKTPLSTVFRVKGGWLVFTHCRERSAKLAGMLGTALLLRDNGTAARVTYRPDDEEHMMEIYP